MKSPLSQENTLVLHVKRKHLISQTRDTTLQTPVTILKQQILLFQHETIKILDFRTNG